ncbi:hypothetical protein [Pyxidicoccus trucidator]|uniref:hypothetical protein n=1 Tax=Pyxidicoccus trucidator TaxID=2709662 RepID=UPI0013D9962E|nr:hypothetical protein [Pyxidicoccus trucidator]
MSEPSFEFGVVCEALADQRTACELADRTLREAVEWLDDPVVLDSVRRWRGLEDRADEPFLKWAHVKDAFKSSSSFAHGGVRSIFGPFNGEAAQPDALSARKALLLFAALRRCPDAVLLVRDSDADPDRIAAQGLKQVREKYRWPFKVVIGMAHPKREAWVLAGFVPRNAGEESRLQELRARLSLDPITASHELAASEHGAKKDIKRALDELTQEDWERERQCLEETPLAVLEQRGQKNGLAEFLKEVRERLVPLLNGAGRAG